MRALIYYTINILFCLGLRAQEMEPRMRNFINIEKLKTGTLLVRLESRDSKIRYLESSAMAKNCEEKCKRDIRQQIDEITGARDEFNKYFINAFNRYFRFCPVVFYYDKDHADLVKSSFKGRYYLDTSLNYVDLQFIHPDSILILKKDFTMNSENEGWLFQTVDGITLRDGFPFIDENNYKTLFTRLASSKHVESNCRYMVKTLNKKLFKFLNH